MLSDLNIIILFFVRGKDIYGDIKKVDAYDDEMNDIMK